MNDQKIINYLLNKQFLIKKKSNGDFNDILLNQIGLHSTDNMTPYISLWNRVNNFQPEELFNGLNKLNYLRKRAFRGTVFVIHRELFPLLNVISKIFAINWFKGYEKELVKLNIDFNTFTEKALSFFKNKNDLKVSDLKKLMKDVDTLPSNLFSLALRYFELDGKLVRTTHKYLNDKSIRYGLVEDFFPEVFKNPIDPDDALNKIFLNYIKQFGPITIDDFCWWLPTTKTKCKELINNNNEDITEMKFNNLDYLILKDDLEKLNNFEKEDKQNIINFLPYEDHFPKAYKIREWFLPEELEKIVIGQEVITMGQLYPTIWLNGRIIGQWEISYQDKKKTEVKVNITNLIKSNEIKPNIIDQINQQKKELENFINNKLLPLNQKKK
ncbi:MAG: winged helix DNA-binding domain-containing protein [Asgard group archaeon]|nr:winged helix DNA-binding domain-containing protein [Asgard group archaeon]